MLDRYDEAELLEYVEGGLEARRAEALSRELEADPAAAAMIERMRRDRSMLRSMDEPDVPADLMHALEPMLARQMLLDPPRSQHVAGSIRAGRRVWPRFAAVAAIVALALLAGVWATTMGLPWPSSQPSPDVFAHREAVNPKMAKRGDPAAKDIATDLNQSLSSTRSGVADPGVAAELMTGSTADKRTSMPDGVPALADNSVWPPADAEIHHHEADLGSEARTMARSAEVAAPDIAPSKHLAKGGGSGGAGGSEAGDRDREASTPTDDATQGQESAPTSASAPTHRMEDGLHEAGSDESQHAQALALEVDADLEQAGAHSGVAAAAPLQFIAADFVVVIPATDPSVAEFNVCNAVNELDGSVSFVRNFTYDEALELERQVQLQQGGANRARSAQPGAGVGAARKQVPRDDRPAQEPLTQERLDELALNCEAWHAEQTPASTSANEKLTHKAPAQPSAQLAGPAELMTPYMNQLQFSLQGASHTIAVPAPMLEHVLNELGRQPGQQTLLRSMRPEACTTDLQATLPPAWVWLRDRRLVIESIQRLAQRPNNDVVLVPVVVDAPSDSGADAAQTTPAAPRPAMKPTESTDPGQRDE